MLFRKGYALCGACNVISSVGNVGSDTLKGFKSWLIGFCVSKRVGVVWVTSSDVNETKELRNVLLSRGFSKGFARNLGKSFGTVRYLFSPIFGEIGWKLLEILCKL